jgi:hypothetical protein
VVRAQARPSVAGRNGLCQNQRHPVLHHLADHPNCLTRAQSAVSVQCNLTSDAQHTPGRHGLPSGKIRGGPFLSPILFHPFTSYQTTYMKIKHVTITPMPRPMPLGMFDPMPEVIATFEDDSTKTLFAFYPDEISFTPSEFIGLAEEEAHTLFQRKDHSYLRS